MPKQSDIVIKTSEFVSQLFKERLPEYLVYHTFGHSEKVADTSYKIGKGMKLGDEGLEIVTLAGWLHDTGYTEIYRGHEEISMRIAREFLRKENYPEEKISLITGCIKATKIPQQPQNLLEEIVADADLAGLGRKSFFADTELLHYEWKTALSRKYSQQQWMQQNLELLTGHTFFTIYAREKYTKRQNENTKAVAKILHKLAEEEEIFGTQNTIDNFEWANRWDSPVEIENEVTSQEISETIPLPKPENDIRAQIMTLACAVIPLVIVFSLIVLVQQGVQE